jgi:hypothetical protein
VRETERERTKQVLFQRDTESGDRHVIASKIEAKTYDGILSRDCKILLGRQRDTVEHLDPRPGLLVESRKCQLRNDCILANSSSSRCSL